jgi:hypothetical protein
MARIYNYLLGGKDNFAADRAQADRLVQLYPPLPVLTRENRAFLLQAVRWQPGRASGSSSTWAQGSRRSRRSTRWRGRSCPQPRSPTSTTTIASRVVHTHGLLANSRRNRPQIAQLDPSAPEPKYLRVPKEETTHGPWV